MISVQCSVKNEIIALKMAESVLASLVRLPAILQEGNILNINTLLYNNVMVNLTLRLNLVYSLVNVFMI